MIDEEWRCTVTRLGVRCGRGALYPFGPDRKCHLHDPFAAMSAANRRLCLRILGTTETKAVTAFLRALPKKDAEALLAHHKAVRATLNRKCEDCGHKVEKHTGVGEQRWCTNSCKCARYDRGEVLKTAPLPGLNGARA